MVTRVLFRNQIAESLRDAILGGQYSPGERLRVETICKQLGVSATPVQSALVMLEQEGLVVNQPHRGVFVRSFSDEEIAILLRVISVNEGLAVRLAAAKITERDLKNLKKLHQKAGHNSNLSTKEFQEYDREFHHMLVQASQTELLINLVDKHLSQFYLSRYYVGRSPERIQLSLQEHALVLSALEKRDPEEAEKAIKTHFQSAIADLSAH